MKFGAALVGVLVAAGETDAARMRVRRDTQLSAVASSRAGGQALIANDPVDTKVINAEEQKAAEVHAEVKVVDAHIQAVKGHDAGAHPTAADHHDGPVVVTKDFCWSVLEGVQERVPPYFDPTTGTYTPECRDKLVKDCGEIVCGWGARYKTIVETCSGNPFLCPTAPCHGLGLEHFFSNINSANFPQLAATLLAHRPQLVVASDASGTPHALVNVPQTGAVAGVVVAPRFKKSDESDKAAQSSDSKDSAAKGETDNVGDETAAPQRLQHTAQPHPQLQVHSGLPVIGLQPVVVTDAFCNSVIEGVVKKAAPYYVEDHVNTDLRKDLYDQCGAKICGWGLKLAAAYKDICKQDCMCPDSCNSTSTYVDGLFQSGLLGAYHGALQTHDVIAIPHAPADLKDPSTSKVTLLRGGGVVPGGIALPSATEVTITHKSNLTRVKPSVTSIKEAIADIQPNDPRDPALHGSAKQEPNDASAEAQQD